MYAELSELKEYLKIDQDDVSEDIVLNMLLEASADDIDLYTTDKFKNADSVPTNIKVCCIKLAAIQYRSIGAENLKSETIGPLSSTYNHEMPIYIQNILNRYRGAIV